MTSLPVRFNQLLSIRWQIWLLMLILGFALGIRMVRLGEPPTYYFDEVYHGVTAKAYAQNNPAGYEWWHEAPEPNTAYEWLHPPVAKLLMAFGWKTLGQTAWAWRVPGALVGTGVVLLVFYLAYLLFGDLTIAVLSALLASLDGLLLAQSRIGMNDIYVTFFMVATVIAYIRSRRKESDHQQASSRRWLALSGLLAGLSMSTKWSGVFVLPMIGVWEMHYFWQTGMRWLRRLPLLLLIFVIIPVLIYLASFGQFWLQGHTWGQFKELHQQIWWYQTHLEATHSYQSKAWEWPLTIRPVWYYVDYSETGKIANIYNLANPLIAWFGLVAIVGIAMEYGFRNRKEKGLHPFMVILTYYAWSWMPWLLSPRIMFYYHYTPAIPMLCLALAYQLRAVGQVSKKGTWLIWIILAAIVLTFVWLLPMWIGLPLPENWWKWLFWLPTWK